MFNRIRRRFTFTGLIAVLALVFAMAGGAWAANTYVITSTNQIKPNVLAQLQKRVTGDCSGGEEAIKKVNENGSVECEETGGGGGGGEETCFPKTGGTLPSGCTETGVWAFGPLHLEEFEEANVPISFPIPLGTELDEEHIYYSYIGHEDHSKCPSAEENNPTAEPGYLCIYQVYVVGGVEKPEPLDFSSNPNPGVVLHFFAPTETTASGQGTFAVTAP